MLKLKEQRERMGFAQTDLAKSLNISQQNLWSLENGQKPISKKMAVKLSNLLGGCPGEYLFNCPKNDK